MRATTQLRHAEHRNKAVQVNVPGHAAGRVRTSARRRARGKLADILPSGELWPDLTVVEQALPRFRHERVLARLTDVRGGQTSDRNHCWRGPDEATDDGGRRPSRRTLAGRMRDPGLRR